jgi:hypothetical protein
MTRLIACATKQRGTPPSVPDNVTTLGTLRLKPTTLLVTLAYNIARGGSEPPWMRAMISAQTAAARSL